jgi:hypothetical protein
MDARPIGLSRRPMAFPRPDLREEPRLERGIYGICERFHKTVLNEFYRIAFLKRGRWDCGWRGWAGGGANVAVALPRAEAGG